MSDRRNRKPSWLVAYFRRRRGFVVFLIVLYLALAGLAWVFFVPLKVILYWGVFVLLLGILYLLFDGWREWRVQASARVFFETHEFEEIPMLSFGAQAWADYWREDLKKWENERQRIKTKLDQLQQFYTLWTHQIKTPLAAAYLLSEEAWVDSAKLKPRLLEMEHYVDLLLGYLRLQTESTDYVIRPFPLAQAVRPVVRKFGPTFIKKNLSLFYEPKGVQVLSDEKWLRFLLEQILSNSLKYTDRGSITIVEDGLSLRLRDTGCGIPAADLPRIFEMGFTGQNGRLDRKSTGLGLSLCRLIAERLSIGLHVESEEGRGTEVVLKFPQERPDPSLTKP